jgi:YVTN family beta-propeller protein
MYEIRMVLILLFGLMVFCISCESDPTSALSEKIPEQILQGVLVVNEGNFLQSNSSLSYYDAQNGTIYNNIFKNINGVDIGDVAYSINLYDTLAYIVVNNSDKIEVMNINNFKKVRTINLPKGNSPRHIAFSDAGKLYVTNLYTNNVSIFNPTSNIVETNIPVGANPDGILITDGYAFVANSGFGSGNTVSVIDLDENRVVKTLKVGYNPQWLELSSDGMVHVLCSGAYNDFFDPQDDTPGGVWIIDPENKTVMDSMVMGQGEHPRALTLSAGGKGYFIYAGNIMEYDTNMLQVTNDTFIQMSDGFPYNVRINDLSGELYVCDAKDYVSVGDLIIYDLQGREKGRHIVGIIPGYVCFIIGDKD